MQCVLGLLAFLLASCGLESGPRQAESNSFIIHGKKCLESEFVSSLEIWADGFVDLSPLGIRHISAPICGGTLVGPDVVLTAAHCFMPELLTQKMGELLRVRYGVISHLDLRGFKKKKRIPKEVIWGTHFKQHEGFLPTASKNRNDLALLYLSQSLLVKPVPLLSAAEKDQLKVGVPVNIVGWGSQAMDSDDEDPATTLNKMCAVSSINELGEFEMQIGSDETSARKCFGDSGGATYVQLLTGEYRLIGVTSRAYDTSNCARGGVDTRVDAYYDWIQGNLTDRLSL